MPTNGSVVLTLVYLKPVERPAAFAPFYELLGTPLVDLHRLHDAARADGLLPRVGHPAMNIMCLHVRAA